MKFYKQQNSSDCGIACLRMITAYYGNTECNFSTLGIDYERNGLSILNLKQIASNIGLDINAYKCSIEELLSNHNDKPSILLWDNNHYVVICNSNNKHITIADPAIGIIKYNYADFEKHCRINNAKDEGIIVTAIPNKQFIKNKKKNRIIKFCLYYITNYKWSFILFIFLTVIGSIINLTIPIITQTLVDKGIYTKDLNYIVIILIAQVSLHIGQLVNEFCKSYITTHLTSRINISITTSFIKNLLNISYSYLQRFHPSDILQRIEDSHRIQKYITSTLINLFISIVSIIFYSCLIASYDIRIVTIFITGSIANILWTILFFKKRRIYDNEQFQINSDNNKAIINITNGIQEIKINNCKTNNIQEWEILQKKVYTLNIKAMRLEQLQYIGSSFINQLKNCFIIFLSADFVIKGDITIGIMMAMQYLLGQINTPLNQIISFMLNNQDASLSFNRLEEINNIPKEENSNVLAVNNNLVQQDIIFRNVKFRYNSSADYIFKNLSFTLLHGKVNAIVGLSGSGKSTIIRLLLRLYEIEAGCICYGNIPIKNYGIDNWREKFSTIMQNGYIFPNSIEYNITLSNSDINYNKLDEVCKLSNIYPLIESLPLKYKTIIGDSGKELSLGEKQRILIARAIYRDRDYIIMDEATNSLDTFNESNIIQNISLYCKNKTLIIIAHRLSTIKNADNIIVLNKGCITEQGSYCELIKKKGTFYNLQKCQL